MQVDNWVFTALDLPVPFEVYSLAFQAKASSNSAASIKVVAAIYEGFQTNGFQYVPWRPLSSLAPDGTFKSRFTCDTAVTGSALTPGTGASYRVMVRPDPITRNPIILDGGKRYWIAANWDAVPTPFELLTRTVTNLPRFDGVLDCARDGSQAYTVDLEPPTYSLRQAINALNGPSAENVGFVAENTATPASTAQKLSASIDWALCGRRLR